MAQWQQAEPMAMATDSSWKQCEAIIRDFESAFLRNESPRIQEYLTVEQGQKNRLLAELIHIELEFRLKANHPARIEEYLHRFPELALDAQTLVQLVKTEYQLRRNLDETVSSSEYERRFPHLGLQELDTLETQIRTATRDSALRTLSVKPPHIPGYELLDEIGRGGMGIIFRARDPKLDRLVALKFLPDEYLPDSEQYQRFLHEARTSSALNHPNICTVHALGELEGRPYIVLEFIEGMTLRSWASRDRSHVEVIAVVAQILQALVAAHTAGIIHRDIKPENVMIRSDGLVKVVDFGLARQASRASERDQHEQGAILGTAAYMSPEQTRGETLDAASDIFSLGIVLYELVTGQHPFPASSATGMMRVIETQTPVPASSLRPSVPRPLGDVIDAMLQKEKALRPLAAEIISILARLQQSLFAPAMSSCQTNILHREVELAMLRSAWQQADAGKGAMVCVSGEPGIGKTTLLEDFLHDLRQHGPPCTILFGACSERIGSTEAYMPVLDALNHLCRIQPDHLITHRIKQLAPSWHAQLVSPPPCTDLEIATPPRAMTQSAMLREFWQLLEEVGRRGPVVLCIDDIHWADISTVDLLARLGALCRSSRLLLLAAYRPTELLMGPHPFQSVKRDLLARGMCQEISLNFLSPQQVRVYLDGAFPKNDFSLEFHEFVHSRTEGNPLFITDLLLFFRQKGVITERSGVWSLAQELSDVKQELPHSVRGMIDRKLEYVAEKDLALLKTAALLGREFDSLIVAETLELTAEEVEKRFSALEKIHGLIRTVEVRDLPDHALSLRFAFVHDFYQQALLEETLPHWRSSQANRIARALQNHHQSACPWIAHELASLFEIGRNYRAATEQYLLAAQHAAQLFAHRESISLACQGLGHLAKITPLTDRENLELSLQTLLGSQLQLTNGYAAPDAKRAYERAAQLVSKSGDEPCKTMCERAFPVWWGLWLIAKVRSELETARHLAQRLESQALRSENPVFILQAQQALAVTALCRGEFDQTIFCMEKALPLYDAQRHQSHSFLFGQDPAVACQAFGAVALALSGEAERAKQVCRRALELSYQLSQPTSQALALHFAAMLHQLCAEPQQTLIFSEMAISIAKEHNFAFWHAGSTILRGWALASLESPTAGIEMMKLGIHEWEETASVTYMTYYQGLLAEILIKQNQYAEAEPFVVNALQLAEATKESLYEPRLSQLQAQLLSLSFSPRTPLS